MAGSRVLPLTLFKIYCACAKALCEKEEELGYHLFSFLAENPGNNLFSNVFLKKKKKTLFDSSCFNNKPDFKNSESEKYVPLRNFTG